MKTSMNTGADENVTDGVLDTPKRKSVVPLWRRPQVVLLGVCLGLGVMSSAGAWAVKSGVVEDAVVSAKWSLIKASTDLGFTVQDVLVTGRSKSSRAELLAALGTARDAPILAYDFEGAKARVESLPWVLHARIERLLPDTLVVHLIERRPIALWQNQGDFALIDEDGKVITRENLGRYAGLIQVVGADAPNRVGGLLELLETQPALKDKVRAAVRVGGRRWDLSLESGVNVRLPEDGAPQALERLAIFEHESGVLSRDIEVLDLRVPDRVIVRRKLGDAPKVLPAPGQKT